MLASCEPQAGVSSPEDAGRPALKLTIGARWALQYGLAVLLALGIFGFLVHQQMAVRIDREARLVAEIQARDLRDSLHTQTEEHGAEKTLEWFRARIQRTVREAPTDLRMGIELVGEDGERLAAAGSLEAGGPAPPWAEIGDDASQVLRTVDLGGEHPFLVVATGAPGSMLQVAIDTQRYEAALQQVRDVLMFSAPLMVLVTAVLGWVLARGTLRPVSQITATAERITSSNLLETIPTRGSGDEIDRLASALNAMIRRIRRGIESMARFNANAAHQIRTPLNRICGQIDATLQKPRTPEEYREVLTYLLAQTHQLAQGVHGLLELSRSGAGLDPDRVARVKIRPLLETLHAFFEPFAEDRGIGLRLESVPDALVRGEPTWLRQLFSNLVDNAIKYGRPGDAIRVRGSWQQNGLAFEIVDNGPGIAPEHLEMVFDRFERGGAEGKVPGFGLGLAIAHEIARAHSGRIEVESRVGVGTTFRVWLPAEENQASSEERSSIT